MVEWFRNVDWSAAIAAEFEARLQPARRKAEYLTIQGYTLMPTRPEVAVDLLRRAVAQAEPETTARAGLYLGAALALVGDIDGGIVALESAIAYQEREPMHRTGAHLDLALLVALAQRSDLYDRVLHQLERERVLPFADQELSALIAQALIRGERGEDVRAMAAAALVALGDDNAFGVLNSSSLRDQLTRRLRGLAGSS